MPDVGQSTFAVGHLDWRKCSEEGHASQSRPDFIAKYSVACKEARETHYWLRLLAASESIPVENLQDLTDEADQLVAILTTIVKKCRANNEKLRM